MTDEVTPTQQAETALLLEENIDKRVFEALNRHPHLLQDIIITMLQQSAYDYRLRQALQTIIGDHQHTVGPHTYTTSTTTTNWR